MKLIVFDSDLTIAFIKAGIFPLMNCLSDWKVHLTEMNYAEIYKPGQRPALDAAIQAGHVTITPLSDPNSLQLFGQLVKAIGRGEAAAISLAVLMGAHVGMHDQRGIKSALTRIAPERVHGLEDFLVEGVSRKCLSETEATEAILRLKAAKDYHSPALAKGIVHLLGEPAYGLARQVQRFGGPHR